MPITPEEQYQKIDEIHFLENLKFIPGQLVNFFVSNIVQRSIAHLVGWTGTHAKMIKCTEDGRLEFGAAGSAIEKYGVESGTGADTYTTANIYEYSESRIIWDFLIEDYDAIVSFRHPTTHIWGDDMILRIGAHSIELTAEAVRIKNRTAGQNVTYQITGFY